MADIVVTLILVLIIGCAVRYIYKEKKKGVQCIGCPSAGGCSKKETCSSLNAQTLQQIREELELERNQKIVL